MTADFVLQASADQSELSNVRTVTQSVNLTCPIYNGCNVSRHGNACAGAGEHRRRRVVRAAPHPAAPHPGAPHPEAVNQNGAGPSGPQSTTAGGEDCATASPGKTAPGVAFGALAGVLGLFVGRAIRVRRRKSQSKG